MRMVAAAAVTGAFLCSAGCTPSRQVVAPEVTFESPMDTIHTRYSQLPAAAWLGGQRWAVVSQEFEEAIRADFQTHGVQPLGGAAAKGRHPASVFAVGDTAYVGDWGAREVGVWGPDDQLIRTFPAPSALRGALPRSRDAAGQFYFEASPPPGRLGEGNRDSAAVVRSGPEITRFDTVAHLAPLDIAEVLGRAGRRFERRVYSGDDEWGALPDGTIWVARVYYNRVIWIGRNGESRRGPSLPDPVYPVTEADREYFYQQFPPELRGTAEELPFAAVKPPFERGFTAPDGTVWLQKTRLLADSVRRYQIVGSDGQLRRVLILPHNGVVLAIGDGLVLVGEQHLAGVRLLQYRIPVGPAEP